MSKVLDDAAQALAKDRGDKKKDSEKKYCPLQPGMGCLTQKMDGFGAFIVVTFAVPLFLALASY